MPELEALAAVGRTAESRELPDHLVGVTARGIVVDRISDDRPVRATRDVDVGVPVST